VATVDIASARARYVSAKEAAAMLDNLVTPRDLQRWARQGRIVGALKVGPKTWRFDRRGVLDLVRDMSAERTPSPHGSFNVTAPAGPPPDDRPLTYRDRRGHVTFDPQPLN
jgi:hypothetical protein